VCLVVLVLLLLLLLVGWQVKGESVLASFVATRVSSGVGFGGGVV
jgi:hypothetical protein